MLLTQALPPTLGRSLGPGRAAKGPLGHSLSSMKTRSVCMVMSAIHCAPPRPSGAETHPRPASPAKARRTVSTYFTQGSVPGPGAGSGRPDGCDRHLHSTCLLPRGLQGSSHTLTWAARDTSLPGWGVAEVALQADLSPVAGLAQGSDHPGAQAPSHLEAAALSMGPVFRQDPELREAECPAHGGSLRLLHLPRGPHC